MRNIAYGLLIAVALIMVYTAVQYVREEIEIGPSKRAVLAMTSDQYPPVLASPGSVSALAAPPNIVIILADDLGWRDVGYNKSEVRTPVIDRLASEGITLNRFYAQPTCSPTRAALMTGKSPLRLGIVGPLPKNAPTGLPLSEKTLADQLGAAGYQTALVGKWHLGGRDLDYHPNRRGFDHFYGHVTGGVGYYDKVHGGGYDWQRNGETLREDGYTTHLIASEAVRLIEERDPERPLFLYAAFGAPHLPNEAPEASIDAYRRIGDKKRRVHAAMVSELDTAIGTIQGALEAAGIEDNTLIWFMSDNGGLVAKNLVRHVPDPFFTGLVESAMGIETNPQSIDFIRTNLRDGRSDNRPFKGAKGAVSEGGVRVPSFIYWPNQFDSNVYNHMVTVQDVMPTLLRLSGRSESEIDFDGRDLFDGLKTNMPAPPTDYFIKATLMSDATAIYRYPYKLIKNSRGLRLYDLENDPLEQKNVAGDYPGLVTKLANDLANFPQAEPIGVPLQDLMDDPDFFGGEEDRAPWVDQAYETH